MTAWQIVVGTLAAIGACFLLTVIGLLSFASLQAWRDRRTVPGDDSVPPEWAYDDTRPLDERDVELWCRQVITADADQIMREANR